MQASSIVAASQAAVNSQAGSVSNDVNLPHDYNHSTRQPPTVIVREVYVPCSPTYTATSAAACDDLEGIATVLTAQWEHLRPGQALQLIVQALEDCRPFVPGELGGIIDLIAHGATRVRYRRDGEKGPVA